MFDHAWFPYLFIYLHVNVSISIFLLIIHSKFLHEPAAGVHQLRPLLWIAELHVWLQWFLFWFVVVEKLVLIIIFVFC